MVSFLGWVYPDNDIKVTEDKIASTESGKDKLEPLGEVKFLGRLVEEFGTDVPLASKSYGAYYAMNKVGDNIKRTFLEGIRVFVHPDRDDYMCNGYFWKEQGVLKGYIVHPDDEEAINKAFE